MRDNDTVRQDQKKTKFPLIYCISVCLSAALSERPFYEEWWFLLVMALVGLILILVLVFTLLLHGHSTKYKACSTGLCLCCSVSDVFTVTCLLHVHLFIFPLLSY